MSRTRPSSGTTPTRPSLFAITGVLGIVLFSVALGVLGPQIVRRSSLAVGLPLSSVLEVVHAFYQAEEFMRWRRSPGDHSDGSDGSSLPEATITEAVKSALGGRVEILRIDAPRLVPASIQRDVALEYFERPGVAVVYRESLPGDSMVRPANLIMLYMPLDPGLRDLHARDEFGVLGLLGTGQPVVRMIRRGAGRTWILFWMTDDALYFLLAPSEELLDYVIEHSTLGLPGPMPATSARSLPRGPVERTVHS